MDKAEAIKILKDFHDESAIFSVRTALETLHPELKESEDEKVRKTLIRVLNENVGNGIEKYGAKLEEALAWLEKQVQPRMQYGITINGVEYEMVEDQEDNECERCALNEQCHRKESDVLCTPIFGSDIAAFHRFKMRTK